MPGKKFLRPAINIVVSQLDELAARRTRKEAVDPMIRHKALLKLGERLAPPGGVMPENTLAPFLQGMGPKPSREMLDPEIFKKIMKIAPVRESRKSVLIKEQPNLEKEVRAMLPFEEARKVYHEPPGGYTASSTSQSGDRIRLAELGETPSDWETNPAAGVIGPPIPQPGFHGEGILRRPHGGRYIYEHQIESPVKTAPQKRKAVAQEFMEAPEAEVATWAQDRLIEGQAHAIWDMMKGEKGQSSGTNLWRTYFKELATDTQKKNMTENPGFQFFYTNFLKWRKNPDAFARNKKFGKVHRMLNNMWEIYMKDLPEGKVR